MTHTTRVLKFLLKISLFYITSHDIKVYLLTDAHNIACIHNIVQFYSIQLSQFKSYITNILGKKSIFEIFFLKLVLRYCSKAN